MGSKYTKSQKVMDSVKRCYFFGDLKADDMIEIIEFDTGERLTRAQLAVVIEEMKKEVRETEIEVNTYMNHMVSFGIMVDQIQNHEMLKSLKNALYVMVTREVNKGSSANKNFILAGSNQLTKIMEAMDRSVMSAGYIKKAQAILEQNKASELEKTTKIMIENKEHDTEELIEQSIDKRDLEDNRIA